MMLIRFVLSVWIVLSFSPYLMAWEPMLCAEKAEKYSTLFADYLKMNDLGKMEETLLEWEQSCGISEPVFRSRLLLRIMQNQFPDTLNQSQIFDYAVAYDIRYELIENEDLESRNEFYNLYDEFFGFVPVGLVFDRQTQMKSSELLRKTSANELTIALLTLYSGDTDGFFRMLREGALEGSELSESYFTRVKKLQKKPEFNIGISSGIWVPGDDLKVIGIKPTIGGWLGVRIKNTSLNGVFDIRFGKSRLPFEMNVMDTLVKTRNHQGAYLGLEINQVIIKKGNYRLGLFASGGYNIIDIVEDKQAAHRQTFGSWAFHLGPFYQYIFHNRTSLGIKPAFHVLNHHNSSGSPMSGNAFTLKVVFGISENAGKTKNLQRLGY